MRVVIFGNSGSGKSTLARATAARRRIPHLDLDGLAWDPGPCRRPIERSASEIDAFVDANPSWVIEGCYGDLIGLVLDRASEIVFLNPGVEVCVANCRARPWEPGKYPSREAQDANLDLLIRWVREYETRRDEFSLRAHRALFDQYAGPKREVTDLADFGHAGI